MSTLHTSEGAQLCKGVVLAALHRARWCECDALGEVRLELEEPVLGEDRAPLHLPPVSSLVPCVPCRQQPAITDHDTAVIPAPALRNL